MQIVGKLAMSLDHFMLRLGYEMLQRKVSRPAGVHELRAAACDKWNSRCRLLGSRLHSLQGKCKACMQMSLPRLALLIAA
mmetsp:Transcript_140388/g.364982  ORF Transcript_140388/g.364982 Transcript_140388/m.364982 type:complete len:80 (+) Transcript_140388:306-545(+)